MRKRRFRRGNGAVRSGRKKVEGKRKGRGRVKIVPKGEFDPSALFSPFGTLPLLAC